MQRSTLAFLIFLLLSACQKNTADTEPDPQPNIPKVKKWIVGAGSDTIHYEYYPDGKQKKKINQDGSYTETIYTATAAFENLYNTAGILVNPARTPLNSIGLIDSSARGWEPLGFVYQYNSNQQVEKVRYIDYYSGFTHYEVFFFYDNGNRVKDSMAAQGSFASKTVYEYYPELSTIEQNPNFGVSYQPVMNKNCVKKMVSTTSAGVVTTWDYAYEFDTQGRVSKKIISAPTGSGSVLYEYY